jgi:hypothetical protein
MMIDESIALRTAFYLRSLTHKQLLLKKEHNSYIHVHGLAIKNLLFYEKCHLNQYNI